MLKNGQIFEAVVEKLGFGGEGIIKIDNFVIFVKGAIPEQLVKAVITKKHKNHAEAKVIEIIKPAINEITPKCKHFGICGGCKWQNIKYTDQLNYKLEQVKDCYHQIGHLNIDNIPINIQASPQEFAYRNKVEFSFGYQSMTMIKQDNAKPLYFDENPTLGFHKPNKWEEIVDIHHCDLISESANTVFQKIKKWTLSQDKEVYNPKTHRGFWRHLLLRENLAGDILVNLVINENINEKTALTFFNDLIKEIQVCSFYITIHTGLNDDWTQGEIIHLAGDKEIYETMFDLKFAIAPASFFQTNSLGAQVLYSQVKDIANDLSVQNILDLYCGTGTIGQILAGNNKNTYLTGIDIVAISIANAQQNAKINQLTNTNFIVGTVEKLLADCLAKSNNFDLVIIDPPRAGMHSKALQTLISAQIKHLIYISCNPATQARDLEILVNNGYKINKIYPVDMFPHTAHIEVIVSLMREK